MDVFSAIADPTRRQIIELLARRGRLAATDIYDRFPMSHPAISQHLQVLRAADLVRVEKQAQHRIYELNPAALTELETWVQRMTAQWNERFAVLDEILQEEKKKLERKKRKK